MSKNRLEAFSDGVLAIIITIMVLELKVPHGGSLDTLKPLIPIFLSYVLSFLYVGIYWNNHHHLLHACNKITAKILWSNLYLLFWLSLLPFATGWLGENHFTAVPAALYGLVLLMSAIAYTMLQFSIIGSLGDDSKLKKEIGKDIKGKISVASYLLAIIFTLWNPMISQLFYVFVALLWLIPDKRIERVVEVDK